MYAGRWSLVTHVFDVAAVAMPARPCLSLLSSPSAPSSAAGSLREGQALGVGLSFFFCFFCFVGRGADVTKLADRVVGKRWGVRVRARGVCIRVCLAS